MVGNVFSEEYINRLFDRNYYELDKSGAYLREGKRWEASSFSTDLTKLKSNVREVLMWLDECVKVKAKY